MICTKCGKTMHKHHDCILNPVADPLKSMVVKKRVMLTLTAENVERFQNHCRANGLPLGTLSASVDEFLRDILKVVDRAVDTGKFGMRDMFEMMGDTIEKLQEGDSVNEKKRKEEKPE